MNYDVDPATVLTAVGVIFAVAAVAYFARDIVFDLSITVRALLLFLAFAALLVSALASTRDAVVVIESVLAAAAYLAFLTYTLSRFEVGADGTFLALLVSAILFLALGYLLQERGVSPSKRTARSAVVAIALLAVVLIGADVAASEVTYDVQIAEEATVGDDGVTSVGTLTVDNKFLFREHLEEPRAFACIYRTGTADGNATDEPPWRPHPIEYRVDGERLPDTVPGGATITAAMTVRLGDEERATADGSIPVERAESCPPESTGQRIVVVRGTEVPRPPRPH
jgi:hypothetical protein